MTSRQRSSSATNRSQGNGSVFKYSLQMYVQNWNHNNNYASLLQSSASEQDQHQSDVTGHSTSQLGIKRHATPVLDKNLDPLQLVSRVEESAAPYFPPTLLNYFHSQGHAENDSLRQQSPGTNQYDNAVNTSRRQHTPSTLNEWSPLSEDKPSYSKFTLGPSSSIFPSLLFPQQVVNPNFKKPTSSSFGDEAFISEPILHHFGKYAHRPPMHAPPPVREFAQKSQLHIHRRYPKNKPETRVTTPTRPQPDFDWEDECPRYSQLSPTIDYSLDDISEKVNRVPYYRKVCPSPPCFQLSAEFGEEPTKLETARPIGIREFPHFVNSSDMAGVMFFDGKTSQNTRKVWDKEAKEKNDPPYRVYGTVNCDEEKELCKRANATNLPFYIIYAGSYPIFQGPYFKPW